MVKVESQCHGNAAATRAHVEHLQWDGRLQGAVGAVVVRNNLAAQRFGLRTGDEYAGPHMERTAAEVGTAQHILHRFALPEPRHDVLQPLLFGRRQLLHLAAADVGHGQAEALAAASSYRGTSLRQSV